MLLVAASQLLALAAQSAATSEVQVPEWEFSLTGGTGVLENPIKGKQDGETFLLPSFSYYGENFFVSNLTAGFYLHEDEHFYLDLVARPNEDGLYFQLDKDAAAAGGLVNYLAQAAAPEVGDVERKISVMVGPSMTLVSDFADVSFSWLHDISGVHNGTETQLSFDKQFPLFAGNIGFGIGAIQKDADLVGYYYHFNEAEMGLLFNRYRANFPVSDSTDTYARLNISYPLGKNFSLQAGARYNRFDIDGRDSRFIEHEETLSWFAGLQYTIGSEQ